MLSRMVKQLVAAGLSLAFMFTSALCLAAPNDKSDDTLPSVPDAESGTEHAAGVGVDYYGHADNAYFSGIGSDMTTKLKDMLSASVSSEYGIGIRFNMDEAMEEYDFSSDDLSGLTIGIDPGHQLIADDELEPIAPGSLLSKVKQSSGSVGVKSGTGEHTINLIIANKLAGLLRLSGANVIMSRTDADVSISNSERAEMMNEADVDFWIRLHCESAQDANTSGCTVLIPSEGMLFSSVLSSPAKPRGMSRDITTRETKEASAPADNDMYVKSLALATAVIKEFCTFTGAQPLGIVSLSDHTGFNYSDSPVIAIEMGCLSNEADDIRLNRAAYQDACAFGIYRGINQYAAMIESGDYDIASLLEGYSSDSESTKEK